MNRDGALDYRTALKWCAGNNLGAAGDRARHLLRDMDDEDEPDAIDIIVNIATGAVFSFVPAISAAAAKDAGLDPAIADRVALLAHRIAVETMNAHLPELLGESVRRDWPPMAFCRRVTV